jgi:NTE family protein
MILQGEAAARGVAPRLAALEVSDAAYQGYMARRATQQPGLPVIKFVRVDPDSRRYEKTILAEMEPLVGKPLDLDAVGCAHHRSVRARLFRDVGLHGGRARAGPEQEYGLEVRARRKSWGPNYVRFGLALESNFQGSNQYNVAASFCRPKSTTWARSC